MQKIDLLTPLVKNGVVLREVEDAIFSVLPAQQAAHPYDNKVVFYDALIGNRFYNRLVWGNWPDNYRAFCRGGLATCRDGLVLDVGCGSLVFTAPVYAGYRDRPVVLLDRSLGMLRKAKERLIDRVGAVPDNFVLMQGDALDLPFHDAAFSTVFSFGMLHIFENLEDFAGELLRVKSYQGGFYATCLAAINGFSRKYLNALQQAGEVGIVCDDGELQRRLSVIDQGLRITTTGNMAYVVG